MIELPLRIECGSPCREPAAWFIPGDDVHGWLDEIARWSLAHDALRLFIVHTSRQNLHPAGVLVVCPGAEKPDVSPRCLGYGCIAGRLYLPVEARLQPDVSDEELTGLLDREREYVFHPGAGLCGFGPEDVRCVADLLRPPTRRERAWDRARPGVTFARRLVSLTPEQTPSVEQIMQQGRDDIGSRGSQLGDLPRSPDEPSSGLASQAGRHAQRLFAGLISWLTRLAPQTSAHPTWVNRLQDWADRKLNQVHDAWNRERMRAILRLMEQLKNDPDRGLKYALPLTAEGRHRGQAPGGNRLTRRDINFSLSQLGGGGTADFWDLPEEYRQLLVGQYRELANRELQLGRHRRAAYIFATLLGDLEAAASALTQGCHWREAAILYREKLNRPLEAANCLERGGLWTEAIALYEELTEFEKAGDLCRRLEQEDAAIAFYERAVEDHRLRQRILVAAGILADKLQRPDEALTMLDDAWPSGACLRESFRLRGSLGRHEEAQLRLRHLRERTVSPFILVDLVESLAEVATLYPDRSVSAFAADTTRVRAAEGLIATQNLHSERLLKAIERLVPEDRLLPRDCQRFLQQVQARPRPVPPASPRRLKPLTLVVSLEVPLTARNALTAVHCRDVIYLAGCRENHLVLAACTWEPGYPLQVMDVWPASDKSPWLLLGMAPDNDDHLVVHVICDTPLPGRSLLLDLPSRQRHLRVGGLAGLSSHVWGLCRPSLGTTWAFESRPGNDHVLLNLSSDGQVSETRSLDDSHSEGIAFPPLLHAWDQAVCIGRHESVLLVWAGGHVEVISVLQPIARMSGSALHKRCRLLLGLSDGLIVFDHRDQSQQLLARDLTMPVSAFIGGGMIAVASAEGVEVYREEDSTFVLRAQRLGERATPLAVLPTTRAGRFAIVSSDGRIEWVQA